jgi:hypothetical protein
VAGLFRRCQQPYFPGQRQANMLEVGDDCSTHSIDYGDLSLLTDHVPRYLFIGIISTRCSSARVFSHTGGSVMPEVLASDRDACCGYRNLVVIDGSKCVSLVLSITLCVCEGLLLPNCSR